MTLLTHVRNPPTHVRNRGTQVSSRAPCLASFTALAHPAPLPFPHQPLALDPSVSLPRLPPPRPPTMQPTNIGFVVTGGRGTPDHLVLFDFGLVHLWERGAPMERATSNPSTDDDRGQLRDLTGECGSMRYMSPEVANSLPYNHLSEVFSFGSVLWEMAALRKPFTGLSEAVFKKAVLNGHRPTLKKAWPQELRSLLEDCWALPAERRPDFRDVALRLSTISASSNAR